MHKTKKRGPREITQKKQNVNQTRRKEGRESPWHSLTPTIAKYWDEYIWFHIQDSQLGLHLSAIENRSLFNYVTKILQVSDCCLWFNFSMILSEPGLFLLLPSFANCLHPCGYKMAAAAPDITSNIQSRMKEGQRLYSCETLSFYLEDWPSLANFPFHLLIQIQDIGHQDEIDSIILNKLGFCQKKKEKSMGRVKVNDRQCPPRRHFFILH